MQLGIAVQRTLTRVTCTLYLYASLIGGRRDGGKAWPHNGRTAPYRGTLQRGAAPFYGIMSCFILEPVWWQLLSKYDRQQTYSSSTGIEKMHEKNTDQQATQMLVYDIIIIIN